MVMAAGSAHVYQTSTASLAPLPARLQLVLAEAYAVSLGLRKLAGSFYDPDSLPAGTHIVLEILARQGPQTVPQIARQRSTSRQNIQVEVNRLRGHGCVELEHNSRHKRSPLVRITHRGLALLASAGEKQKDLFANLAARFSASELTAASSVLRELRQLLTTESSSPGTFPQTESRAEAPGRSANSEQNARPAPAPPLSWPPPPLEEEFPIVLL